MLAAAAILWTFWVEPCSKPAEMHCQSGDAQLAEWSLDAWAKSATGALQFQRVDDEKSARLRFYWAGNRQGLYGEARPIEFRGQRGAEIFLRPSVTQTGDALLRDTIVFLTCLHESGHALGLGHTRDFDDIMYSFQFGGDLEEYFARHRRKLKARADVAKIDAISPADARRLQTVLKYSNAF
ncbi:MAG: matrixin family metalloprotease [Acidobacteria bacterium]|nr:matrixin family metalloprotease [Acidobacteriota bacterium]